MKTLKHFTVLLGISALLTTYSEPIAVHALDTSSALQQYEELANRFNDMNSSYGNIEKTNKDEIYDRYMDSIKENTEKLDIEGKLEKFQNHVFSNGMTLEETKNSLNNLSTKEKLNITNNFEKAGNEYEVTSNNIQDTINAIEAEKEAIREDIRKKLAEIDTPNIPNEPDEPGNGGEDGTTDTVSPFTLEKIAQTADYVWTDGSRGYADMLTDTIKQTTTIEIPNLTKINTEKEAKELGLNEEETADLFNEKQNACEETADKLILGATVLDAAITVAGVLTGGIGAIVATGAKEVGKQVFKYATKTAAKGVAAKVLTNLALC